MKLYIKNMVCNRCIYVVENQLKDLNLLPAKIVLGEVDFGDEIISPELVNRLKEKLQLFDFEMLDDRNSQLIERIKLLIIDYVENILRNGEKINMSDYLGSKLSYEYNYLSTLFSSIVGVSIEHYLIQLKTERVKELLFYDEMTLSEISFQMGYSSLAHLSNQFKKVTGLTPTEFKKIQMVRNRKSLDKL